MKRPPATSSKAATSSGKGKKSASALKKKATLFKMPSMALPEFAEVLRLIEAARHRAYQAVNVAMIELYWSVGQHISQKIESEGWGGGHPVSDLNSPFPLWLGFFPSLPNARPVRMRSGSLPAGQNP